MIKASKAKALSLGGRSTGAAAEVEVIRNVSQLPELSEKLLQELELPEEQMEQLGLPEVIFEELTEQQESAEEGQPSAEPQQVPTTVRKVHDSFTGARPSTQYAELHQERQTQQQRR